MILTFRSPVTEPLHRAEWDRPASGAGADDFRVTQRFNDPDFYWSKIDPAKAALGHRATDIGNGRCGYPLVAMHSGPVSHLRDNASALGAPSDALGLRIDCGFGITLEYWHVDRYAVAHGARVTAGQVIAYVGKTGLGSVCHCHIEAKSNGIRFDPEPLMFGGSLTVGAEEDDVKISGKFLRHVQNRRGVLTSDAHFRAGVMVGADQSMAVMPKGTVLYPVVVVEGRPAGTATDRLEWYGAWLWIAGEGAGYRFGYVHSSVLPRRIIDGKDAGIALEPIEAATSVTDLEAKIADQAATISALTRRVQDKDTHIAKYPKG